MSILSVQNLCKKFSRHRKEPGLVGALKSLFSQKRDTKVALDDVSFQINEGELVGYIGPNGAGKSTTVKILSGILVPDGGDVLVMGKTPWKWRQEIVKQLGVVFGQRTQLWWDLPVIESFELLRDIYKVSEASYKRTLDSLVSSLELSQLLHVPVRLLSLGQRMRCDIAASLLHSPRILFLDEPTIGLDAVSKFAVRDFIRALNSEQKVTIVLTTHDMDDIESLCTRLLILNEGKIFLDGTIEELRKTVQPERRLIIDLFQEHDTVHDPEATIVKQEGHRVWLSYNPVTTSTPKLISRITGSHTFRDLFIENPPIEEIIARLYETISCDL